MCTSPNRVFKTGLKTDTGKDLLYFDNHYPSPSVISLSLAERRLKVRIPYNSDFVRFVKGVPFLYKFVDVPCGRCDEDRLANSRQWSYRCLMESKYHPPGSCWFLTLTFDELWCPKSVCKKDLSDFMRRLRDHYGIEGIRFFGCGEYGEQGGRPHYHLILFGCPIKDLRTYDASRDLYTSPTISHLWPFGFSTIGHVTEKSCAYVARYTSKKTGARKGFLLMSRMPGIGKYYLMATARTSLSLDYVPIMCDGALQRVTPPRYLERIYPDHDFSQAKERRVWNARRAHAVDSVRHGLSGTRLDDYLRGVASAKANRLVKKEF